METLKCDYCETVIYREECGHWLKVDKDLVYIGETWPKHFCDNDCIIKFFRTRSGPVSDQ